MDAEDVARIVHWRVVRPDDLAAGVHVVGNRLGTLKAGEIERQNRLFRDVIEDSIRRGFRYLDFGIFTVNMEPNFGLARFKESFGSSGLFRDTLIWKRS